jgi:hypothetical protein
MVAVCIFLTFILTDCDVLFHPHVQNHPGFFLNKNKIDVAVGVSSALALLCSLKKMMFPARDNANEPTYISQQYIATKANPYIQK